MRRVVILLFLLVFGSGAFASDYNIFNLDNGQTVIIKEVRNNPIVTVDTWIKTGSVNENEKNNGVSHFLEHLFFKGSTNHAPGEFDKILETKGAETNAATSKDFTHYFITIPSKYFNLALEMHADQLLHPLIPRKELERERKVVVEEISKDENSPNQTVYQNLMDMLYKTHPYKRKVLGTREIIGTISREDILDYYNKFYSPSNMVTVIVGDVDTNTALAAVKKDFTGEYKKTSKMVYPQEKRLSTQARKISYLPSQAGYMLIGFRGAKIVSPDSYALDVLSTILGDGRSSVLYQTIKEQKQLAYAIGASNTGFKDDGIFYISANFTPDKCVKLEESIFEEVKKIQNKGVTPQQVNLAKNIIERDTYYSRESISNIASEIGYTMVTANDIKFYKNYLDNVKKVTPEDVKRVANKYLGQEKSAVSIVLPDSSKEVEISNKTPIKTESTLISQNNITKNFELSNGATLLVTPNDVNEIIAVSIFAKGGAFLEKTSGVANVMSSVMLKGTKKYTSIELAQVLEDNGIKIQPGIKPDAFTITVLTTKSQYKKTMEILDELVNNATFDEYEIEKVKTEKLNNIKKSRDIPLQVALEEYKNLIFENSPYSTSTKLLEKSIPTIQREDILEYYNKIFAPQNIVISINGNVNADDVVMDFGKIFRKQKGEKFNFSKYASTIPTITSPKPVTKVMRDTKTDWIFIAWQAAGIQNSKDFATMQIIDSILGSGMSSRLFKNIRDQEGLAYQLGSGYTANVLKGSFVVYIGTNPVSLERSKTKLLEEVNRMKTEFVGTKELQEAKDKLIGSYIISQETNLDKASTIGWFETSGKGYKFADNYESSINSVTESDIIEVANKYFNNNYVMSIVKN